MKMRNVLRAFFLLIPTLGFCAINSSVILLGAGGNVLPNASLSLSLNGLVPSATYSVTCYIDTPYPFQYLLLGSSFGSNTSNILSYSLNGNYVKQDQLIIGHNVAVINGTFTNPTTDTLSFTNLDQTNPFNVNNCFAMPIQA